MSKALEIVPLQDEVAHDDLGGLLVLGPQLLRHLGDVRVAGLTEHLFVRAGRRRRRRRGAGGVENADQVGKLRSGVGVDHGLESN